jgi:uncharacterized protein YbdZ (MbtH family)
MKFHIEYTGNSEQRVLIYHADEYSFDMEPLIHEIDFDIVINTLNLTVVDGKVVQIWGFCGLNKKMKASYNVPKSSKGVLRVLDNLKSGMAYGVNKEDWTVHVNIKTGWVCIGYPEKKGNAVEFINNCVAVIDNDEKLVSLWLKPQKLPDI